MVGLPRFILILFAFVATAHAKPNEPPTIITPTSKAPAKPAAAKPVAKSPPTKADILFEGYTKVFLDGKHVGYVVQRFDYNAKTKEYTTISYLRTQPPAIDLIESLKAKSTFDLKPISYAYTSLVQGKPTTIDATFSNGIMTATQIKDGAKKIIPPKKIPPGVFLSSFLNYLMQQQKEPMKVGNKYSFQAIAEEDGNLYNGEAYLKSEEVKSGVSTFRILNTFKGVQYTSNVTPSGDVIYTDSPTQTISTQLVANIQEATQGMSVNSNQLAQLFGSIPKGQDNAVARRAPGEPLGAGKTKEEVLNGGGKKPGVPNAPGVEIKSGQETKGK